MKTPKFLLGAFVASAALALAAPVKSAVYPNIYAATYCDLISYQVPEKSAHAAAAKAAWYDTKEQQVIGPNGKPTYPSVLLAARAIMNRCGETLINRSRTRI